MPLPQLRRQSRPQIRRTKSQPFLRRRPPLQPPSTQSPASPSPSPTITASPSHRQPGRWSESPLAYSPRKSRAFVRVRVSDFVIMPSDRLPNTTLALGPIDAVSRPPCYDLAATPPRKSSPSRFHHDDGISAVPPSSRRHARRSDSFIDIGVQVDQYHLPTDPSLDACPVALPTQRTSLDTSTDTFPVHDCDKVSRLVDIVTTPNASPQSRRRSPMRRSPPPTSLAACLATGSVVRKQVALAEPDRRRMSSPQPSLQPSLQSPIPTYRREEDVHLVATAHVLNDLAYKPPLVIMEKSVSPTSTLLSTFSLSTTISDARMSEQSTSNNATQDSNSESRSGLHSQVTSTTGTISPSTPPRLNITPAPVRRKIELRVLSDVNSEALSEVYPFPPQSEDDFAFPNVDSQPCSDIEVPSYHSIFTKVHSMTESPNLTIAQERKERRSLPSFWHKKPVSPPVKYTFRPLHKTVSGGSSRQKPESRTSALRYLQRAQARRISPIPMVPSPPRAMTGMSVATTSPTTPTSRYDGLAVSRNTAAASSSPMAMLMMVKAGVDSAEARAMVEGVNVPAMSLAPTRMFRKSWIKRASNESNTTSSTEYYEDDYTKFIEKKPSALRLLPHPSFARLIGTDGRALRSSRMECRSNSTISLSTSDEEYRPFDGTCLNR